VPGFASLVDQKRPVRLLTAAILSGKLPHAFLFTGLEGIGKKTAATAFAMACNCIKLQEHSVNASNKDALVDRLDNNVIEPCGRCRSCKKIISKNHPDIHIVKPSGEILKVDQIRELCRKLSLKPYEARIRIAVIADAHRLNAEAGNTLLKTLEEPPDHTVFILTASQTSDLLPTITSRCQHIRFNPISRNSLETYIENHFGLAPGQAAAIASMAGGSMTRAETMAQTDWLSKRKWIINEMEALPAQSINFCLAFAEALSKNKDWVFTAFEIMKNWLRDITVFKDCPEKIINMDLSDKIKAASKQVPVGLLISKLHAIEKAERDIKANANLRLTLDALVITLSEG
jgi:DNA polymerase III subunit delta'